jgi:hypothetical protein
MKARLACIVLVAACVFGGCAARPTVTSRSAASASPAAGAPRADLAAMIEDSPQLPAIGTLEVSERGGAAAGVALESLSVDAHREGDFVEASVDHVFSSTVLARTEGTFRFPLPAGAILLGLSMEIEGKMVSGEIVEREKARKVFERIEDEMRDPALLEWEQGSVFKLRVFPVDPGEHKHIVLRYAAPLRSVGGATAFSYPVQAPAGQAIGRVRVTFDGRTVLDERSLGGERDVVVPVGDVTGPFDQVDGADRFVAVHVRPDWSKVAALSSAAGPRRVLVVVDTSRSMLEEQKLARSAVQKLLASLGPQDSFRVLASDLDTRPVGGDMQLATRASIDGAVAALSAIEPEGATNLDAMIHTVGTIAASDHATAVVYVGDGSATWGETRASELAARAKAALGAVPLHAELVGDGADGDTMLAIANATGAMTAHPRAEPDAALFARRVAAASTVPHLLHARLAASAGEVFPSSERTLYQGDDLVALVRAPKGGPAPVVTLQADSATGPISIPVSTAGARPAKLLAQRWATARIASLEGASGDHKDEIIKLSLGYGVLSKKTSLLVLESDEAYARFAIARKNAKDAAPTVTGGDLESAGTRLASLDPDHLQPGDPEVRIDAPADARRVTVVLPFGETKDARYEPALHAWTVRFLVDRATPDGTYELLVRITLADGTIQLQRLHYIVDTQAPELAVTLRPARRPGTFEIRADQVISAREIAAAIPAAERTGSLDDQRRRFASKLTDARHVEVGLPDGGVLSLTPLALGRFRAYWTPRAPLRGPVRLRVVAFDRAHNQSVRDVTLGIR